MRPLSWQPGDPPPPLPGLTPLPRLLLIDCRVPLPPGGGEALLASLSPLERQRHGALRRRMDQDRFLLARGALRQVLGHWLGRPAALVALESGRHGKPWCAGAPAFNVSHSGDLILLAFHGGEQAQVGVDVERDRPDRNWRPIARRLLPPAEAAALEALPEEERARACLRAWCRLEAKVKAHGLPLAQRDRLGPGPPHSAGAGRPGRGDTLWDVVVPEGYGAAAALTTGLRDHPAAAAGGGHPSPPP